MPHAIVVALAAVNHNRYLLILTVVLNIMAVFATQSAVYALSAIVGIAVLVATFLFSIVINGRIAQLIYQGTTTDSGMELIQKYIFPATVVTILLFAFSIGLELLLHYIPSGRVNSLVLKPGILMLWEMITAYILPIVFIKNIGLSAIPTGVLYFFDAIRSSKPIIYSYGLVYLASIALKYAYINLGSSLGGGLFLPYVVVLLSIFFSVYFQFFIFALATVLLKRSNT